MTAETLWWQNNCPLIAYTDMLEQEKLSHKYCSAWNSICIVTSRGDNFCKYLRHQQIMRRLYMIFHGLMISIRAQHNISRPFRLVDHQFCSHKIKWIQNFHVQNDDVTLRETKCNRLLSTYWRYLPKGNLNINIIWTQFKLKDYMNNTCTAQTY